MNKNVKFLILFIVIGFFMLWMLKQKGGLLGSEKTEKMNYSRFRRLITQMEEINKGKKIPEREAVGRIVILKNPEKFGKKKEVFSLRISPKQITGRFLKPGMELHENDQYEDIKNKTTPFVVIVNPGVISSGFYKRLEALGIDFKHENPDEGGFLTILGQMLPLVLLIGLLWIFMMRQIQSTGNRAMAFGKSKARLTSDGKSKITFADVAGCDEAKEELVEVVDFLKDPKKFHAIGARIPTGVLLVGPPGTGKTLLARAISGEAGVPFYTISGSDFVEMFVGVGASRVRDLFDQAKKNAPCIIFIDEIDAVGRLRGAGLGGGHDEREQTLNQMLVEMDGFEENEGVIVVAATNRPDVLDPALLRPGRFDRQVVVDIPDIVGREAILKIHARKVPLISDVSLTAIARGTPGFTGADLENLVNEAALLAARRGKRRVTQDEMEDAKDKVMMGPERKSFLITPKEKEVIAYHEAGHAILGMLLPQAEPVHKVTIIPRGRALGLTMQLPEDDRHIQPKAYWMDRICVLMGGYIAEELVFHDTATGASNDIQIATNIARRMVCEWGMSEKLGTINYSANDNENVFLGREIVSARHYSDDTAAAIDEEVKRIVHEQLDKGRALVASNRDKLDRLAKGLLAQETISADELSAIIGAEASDNQKRYFAGHATDRSQGSNDGDISPAPIPAV